MTDWNACMVVGAIRHVSILLCLVSESDRNCVDTVEGVSSFFARDDDCNYGTRDSIVFCVEQMCFRPGTCSTIHLHNARLQNGSCHYELHYKKPQFWPRR